MTVPLLRIGPTVPAYPLGIPTDGRQRYSMTPIMAAVYRWLVAHRPHGEAFRVNFREVAAGIGSSSTMAHKAVMGLEERGWLTSTSRTGGWSTYRFVQPVMQFNPSKESRHED
ncbi:MAG TPA: hypothetical protein VK196_17020 [Magnetospirillum sp.]|nr:hypothetical protein [Magnetospirillum sp.]